MKLTISLAQMNSDLKNIQKNLQTSEKYILDAKQLGSTLIVFPEMFLTGLQFNQDENSLQEIKSSIDALCKFAELHQITIVGSTLYPEEEKLFNRLFVILPSGKIAATYDKIHLFYPLEEDTYLDPGTHLQTASLPFGEVGLSICYDIRFPEVFRAYGLKQVPITFCVSAVPHPRKELLLSLLKARAIENQMYIVCCNQVGKSQDMRGNKVEFFGSSCIIDPLGNITTSISEKEELITGSIDLSFVDKVRKDMRVFESRKPECYKF